MISVLASRATLVLALTFLVFGPAHADSDRPDLRSISVSGTGSVAAAPDLASITVGVTTTAGTAGAAAVEAVPVATGELKVCAQVMVI